MDLERESETVVPFWNHTRLSEQLKEVVGKMENMSRQQQEERGRPNHPPPGSTDIASVLAIFGGLLLVLTVWAFIKHFLATSQR